MVKLGEIEIFHRKLNNLFSEIYLLYDIGSFWPKNISHVYVYQNAGGCVYVMFSDLKTYTSP